MTKRYDRAAFIVAVRPRAGTTRAAAAALAFFGLGLAFNSIAMAADNAAAEAPPASALNVPAAPVVVAPVPAAAVPAPVTVAQPVAAAPSLRSPLPQQLSPWTMFQQADVIVKGVIISLIFASLLSWTVWAAKTLEIVFAVRRLRADSDRLVGERSLAGAAASLGEQRGVVSDLVRTAAAELKLSSDVADRAGIKERIASRLSGYEAEAMRRIRRGIVLLASVGATAPFVGLFGTVWGIMNSFIGISKTQTTNLAVVAPGIAEALLATAVGLVAAIPAVVLYNLLMRALATYRVRLQHAIDEVARLVSRDLDRTGFGAGVPHLRAARPAE